MPTISWATVVWGFLAGLGAGFGFMLANGIVSLFQRGRTP